MAKKPKLYPIPEKMVLDRMRFENPWWVTQAIDQEFNAMRRRLYYDLFVPLVTETDIKRAVVLMGPRRVGKTVMMHQTIQHLLDTKIPSQKIAFISIDNPIYLHLSLDQLFTLIRNAVGKVELTDWFVFFDEIQYLKDWQVHLKVLVDSYPHSKFIVSGSAAAALRLRSQESGAGRFTEFMLPPLTFQEYIDLKNYSHLVSPATLTWNGNLTKSYKSHHLKEINRHFVDYINFGGYPEVIFSEKIQSNPGRYIKNDIVDKVLLRDLPSLYGIQDVQELNAFFSMLAYHTGHEVSLNELSKNSNVEKNLLKKYLDYLEAAFLIKVVHRIDDTAKRFQRAVFYKVFLTNPSLRSALFAPLESRDEAMGQMVETAVLSQWMHRGWFTPWYARWSVGQFQGEVDMVGLDEKNFKPQWAAEIKWTDRNFVYPAEFKSLLHFYNKNKLTSALVTTIEKEGIIDQSGIALHYIPSAMYAYMIGANTLEKKRKSN